MKNLFIATSLLLAASLFPQTAVAQASLTSSLQGTVKKEAARLELARQVQEKMHTVSGQKSYYKDKLNELIPNMKKKPTAYNKEEAESEIWELSLQRVRTRDLIRYQGRVRDLVRELLAVSLPDPKKASFEAHRISDKYKRGKMSDQQLRDEYTKLFSEDRSLRPLVQALIDYEIALRSGVKDFKSCELGDFKDYLTGDCVPDHASKKSGRTHLIEIGRADLDRQRDYIVRTSKIEKKIGMEIIDILYSKKTGSTDKKKSSGEQPIIPI